MTIIRMPRSMYIQSNNVLYIQTRNYSSRKNKDDPYIKCYIGEPEIGEHIYFYDGNATIEGTIVDIVDSGVKIKDWRINNVKELIESANVFTNDSTDKEQIKKERHIIEKENRKKEKLIKKLFKSFKK